MQMPRATSTTSTTTTRYDCLYHHLFLFLFIFVIFGMSHSDAFATSPLACVAAAAAVTTAAADDDITAAAAAHCSNDMKTNTASAIGTVNDVTATTGSSLTLKTTTTAAAAATSATTTTATSSATDSDLAEAAATVAAAAAAAAADHQQQQQQQEQRRTYIAQLIVHIRDSLEHLGVAVNDEQDSHDSDDNNDNDNDDSSSHSNNDDDDNDDNSVIMRRIKGMSILIHESMSTSSRNYHSVQHALDVANGLMNDDDDYDYTNNNSHSHHLNDPIAVLAALFHDCIYYHVDGGLSELQLKKLKGAVVCNTSSSSSDDSQDNNSNNNTNKAIIYQAPCCEHNDDDLLLRMVESIFGYEHCQALTQATGLNEFLSAMIAVRELEPLLSCKQLAQIACCIELTIPFRPNITTTITSATTLGDKDDANDHTITTTTTTTTPADRLYANMVRVNNKFDLNMTDDELIQSVQRACILAHSDLANFGTTDLLWFLDNTWSLLPESNEALRSQYLYTVQQFQLAVFKMHGFFNFLSLQPNVIFPSFCHVPSTRVMDTKCENAKRNLQVGRRYVGAKLLSISILSAIAELTGGDAPISLFMGDLPSRHAGTTGAAGSAASSSKRRLGDGLVLPPAELLHSYRRQHDNGGNHGDNDKDVDNDNDVALIDADVYNLLASGRRSETDFDIRQSPLAAYLYGSLGNAGLDDLINSNDNNTILWPMSESAAWSLLKKLPLETVLTPIAENMCQVAVSRCEKIRKILETLRQQ